MKRLFLITLIVIAFVLAGALHGAYYLQEHRAGDSSEVCVYTGNYPEQVPDVVFDSTVISPPLL